MANKIKKEPLGGVSIMALLAIAGTTIVSLNIFRERPVPFKFNSTWVEITDLASNSYNGPWIKLITYEFISNIILVIFALLLMIQLLRKSKYFKITLISFFITKTVFLTFTFYFQTIIRNLATPTIQELTGTGFTTLLLVGLWIPYYMLSEKIDETFIY
ncbi:MAG: DUF2569 domain-containing protein [Spirochaetaceae bacterium]